jgi:hypothetical protein
MWKRTKEWSEAEGDKIQPKEWSEAEGDKIQPKEWSEAEGDKIQPKEWSEAEGDKIQRPKKKDKQTNNYPQNTTQKTKDRATRTPLKTGGDILCSRRICSSCSISNTRRVD